MKIFLFVIIFVILSIESKAHSTLNTSFEVDIYPNKVILEIKVPIEELEKAISQIYFRENITSNKLLLNQYYLDHIKLKDISDVEWDLSLDQDISYDETVDANGIKILQTSIAFSPPRNEVGTAFIIYSDLVQSEVLDHHIVIYLRKDWESGIFSDDPQMIGNIRFLSNSIRVERKDKSLWTGFKSTFLLGMRHIIEGYDHLLFLTMLLLPAPLLKKNYSYKKTTYRNYPFPLEGSKIFVLLKNIIKENTIYSADVYEYKKPKETFVFLFKIVTAFTIGHSLTLILGAIQIIKPPLAWVEVFIAISVMITSMNVVHYFLYKLEIWIAGGFGLIHGLAFSSTVSEFGVHSIQLLLSILGFNLGIELIQFLIILVSIPIVFYIIKSNTYIIFKNIIAILGFFLSGYWIFERIGDLYQ